MTPAGLDLVRGAYGAALLLAPARVLRAAVDAPLDRAALRVARVLGARHLVQAAVLATHPRPSWRLAGAAVDAAHGASMLAVARWSPQPGHRRLAGHSARTAGGFAAAECVTGLRGPGMGNGEREWSVP
jgi:hypothetical protein